MGGGGIVQSEAGIAAVAGFLKGGGREDGGGALIQVKEGGEGASVPCCCTLPSISLSLHSCWL